MPVWESGSGTALALVQAYCRHLCGTAGFGTATQPTAAEVNGYSDMAYYKIAGFLGHAGYGTTILGSAVTGILQNLQVLETVISVELSYPITGPGEPNERFLEFVRQRDALYEMLDSAALSALGVEPVALSSNRAEATGISIGRKLSVTSDGDLVTSRFRRDQFAAPQNRSTTGPREADIPG
jgi:hypothetical protein